MVGRRNIISFVLLINGLEIKVDEDMVKHINDFYKMLFGPPDVTLPGLMSYHAINYLVRMGFTY